MRNLINDNRQLLCLIARYHGQPSRLVHDDRWPSEIPQNVRQLLQKSAAGETRLRNWMSQEWDLAAEFRYDFAEPRHRLALLSPVELQSLKLHCGAAIHCSTITHTIDRERQSVFREVLGDDIYNFALKRASFLTGKLPEELKVATTAGELLNSGQRCINVCVHDAPQELARRMALAFPHSTGLTPADAAKDAAAAVHTPKNHLDTHFICYAIGDSPYGPFIYQGKILNPVLGWTSLHSICEMDGKWFLFYQDSILSKGVTHLKSIKMTEITYREDGIIVTIDPYHL